MIRRRRRRLLGVLCLAAGLTPGWAPGCAPGWAASGARAEQAATPIPAPNLEQVEAAIAEQLRGLRADLDALLVRDDPDPAALLEAYADLGQSYLAYSMLEPGFAALDNAMRLDPEDYRWPYLAGRVAQELNQLDRAADLLGRVLELEPDYLPALIRLGDLELVRQRLEPARRWYEKALEVAPGSPAANYGLGQIAVSENRPEDAIGHFQEVLRVQPSATAVHYPLGLAYRDTGDMDAARRHLAQRGEVGVKTFDPLGDALAERVVGAGLYVSRGNVAYTQGNYNMAIQAYTKAVDADPTNEIAVQGLASAYARAGRPEEAIGVYEEILQRTPDDAVILYNLGTLLSDLGQRERAMTTLERTVEVAPTFDDALFNLALMHEQDGSWQRALELYERLLETNPEDLEARVHRASALAGLGDLAGARAEFEAVIELDPRLGSTYLALAQAERSAGNAERARAAYETAIEQAADARARAQAAFELGNLLAQTDTAGAIAALRLATRHAPEVAAARFALARLLGQTGRFDEAAREFGAGLERNPAAVDAHVGRAIALLLAEREADALAALDAGLAAVEGETTLAHLRARLLAAAADPAVRDGVAALGAAQRVMQRQPNLEHAETVAMALAEVGRFDEAAALQEEVLSRARAAGPSPRLADIERRLESYRAGRPVRTPWLDPA